METSASISVRDPRCPTAVANNPGLTVQKNVPSAGKDTVTLVVPLSASGKFARIKVSP